MHVIIALISKDMARRRDSGSSVLLQIRTGMNLTKDYEDYKINHNLSNQGIEMSTTVRNNKREVPGYLVLASAVSGNCSQWPHSTSATELKIPLRQAKAEVFLCYKGVSGSVKR
jgi:hypothetical protein